MAEKQQPFIFPDGRLKPKDAAMYTGFSEGTLANWRVDGIGPEFKKCRGRVFYLKGILDDWLSESGLCSSTAQARLTSMSLNDICLEEGLNIDDNQV